MLRHTRTEPTNIVLCSPRGLNPGPSEPQASVYTTAPRCLAMAGPVYWADHMHWITNRPIMRRQAVCAVVWPCNVVGLGLTEAIKIANPAKRKIR